MISPYSQAADALSTDDKNVAEKAEPPPILYKYDSRQDFKSDVPVRIQKIVDTTALLSDKGDIYSLTGLDIPDDNMTAPKTQERLVALTEGKKCTLYQTRSQKVGRVNRLNQILGHLTCGKDDNWVQGTLIAEGLARVRTTPENRNQSAAMLALEQTARANKIGLWALPMNAVYTPLSVEQHLNVYGIVEGTVYTTSQNKSAIFLNFTTDWKTDFSIGVPPILRKDFSKLRIDPMALRGKKIRVRGWIRNYNGPYIELDHVEQLEVLGDDKTDKVAAAPQQPQPALKDDPTVQKAQQVIEGLLGEPTPQKEPAQKQFMHTIRSNSKPQTIEPTSPKIDAPVAPVVSKPVVKPVRKSPNP